jgi:hypothetical protein
MVARCRLLDKTGSHDEYLLKDGYSALRKEQGAATWRKYPADQGI